MRGAGAVSARQARPTLEYDVDNMKSADFRGMKSARDAP
jgi:hypothetical protein